MSSTQTRIARPDRSVFDKEFNELKEKLSLHQTSLRNASDSLKSSGSGKNDPEWQKLLDELNVAKKSRDTARASMQGVQSEIRVLESELQKKVREIASLRPKSGPKSEEEFSRAIASLEKQVESGELKLVDEKKTIKEIGYLKTARKSVSGIPKLEGEAAEIKKQIAEKRKTVDDSAFKQANAAINDINAKLDARKSARSEAAKAKNAIYEAKNEAQAQIKAVREAMDAAREAFNAKYAAYREATAEERRRKAEEEKAEKENAARARKISDAEAKVAAAKEPAFSAQISQAQALVDFFAPWSSAPTGAAPKTENVTDETAKNLAEVSIQKAKIVAPPSRKELKRKGNAGSRNDKLRLDVGVIDGLSSLNIAIPRNAEEAKEISGKLEEKIQFYKDNNDRVTKERTERAEEALEKLKKELETTSEVSTEAAASSTEASK